MTVQFWTLEVVFLDWSVVTTMPGIQVQATSLNSFEKHLWISAKQSSFHNSPKKDHGYISFHLSNPTALFKI